MGGVFDPRVFSGKTHNVAAETNGEAKEGEAPRFEPTPYTCAHSEAPSSKESATNDCEGVRGEAQAKRGRIQVEEESTLDASTHQVSRAIADALEAIFTADSVLHHGLHLGRRLRNRRVGWSRGRELNPRTTFSRKRT